jgi:hypothetical protein
MTTSAPSDQMPVTIEHLGQLAHIEGTCLSIFLAPFYPGAGAKPPSFQLRAMTKHAGAMLAERGWTGEKIREFLEPLLALANEPALANGAQHARALFRSELDFHLFQVPWSLEDHWRLERRFQLTPLLAAVHVPRDFYLLSLARNHVRLWHCSSGACTEVTPQGMPRSLQEFLPEQDADRGSVTRSPGGAVFTDSTENEKRVRHFRDFCIAINRAIAGLLHAHGWPLVLASTQVESAIFRAICAYPELAPEGIVASPDDGTPIAVLAENARALVMRFHCDPERKALQLFAKLAGTSRVITTNEEVVKAAYEGRVEHLFFRPGACDHGDYIALTSGRPFGALPLCQDDLVNLAAIDTLMHSGNVWSGGAQGPSMSAVLRY